MKRPKYQLGNTARVKEFIRNSSQTHIPEIADSLKLDEYRTSRIVAYLVMRGFVKRLDRKLKMEDRKDPVYIYKWKGE